MRVLKLPSPWSKNVKNRWFANRLQFASDGNRLLLEMNGAGGKGADDFRSVGALAVSTGRWDSVAPADGFFLEMCPPQVWRRDFSCVVMAVSHDGYRCRIHVANSNELLADPPLHIERIIATTQGVVALSAFNFSQDNRWLYIAESWHEGAYRFGLARADTLALFAKPITENRRINALTSEQYTHRSTRPEPCKRFATLPKGIRIFCLGVSPDNRLVAAGAHTGDTYLVSVRGGETLAIFKRKRQKPDKASAVHRIAFSPQGQQLGVVVDGGLRVWDVKTMELLWEAEDNKAQVLDLAYHPAGNVIAVARIDGAAVFLDAMTGKVLHRYAWKVGQLNSVAFSPDGLTCAAGGEKGQVVVWDVDV